MSRLMSKRVDVGEYIGLVVHQDVGRAVEAADEAFPEWSALTPQRRAEYLKRALQLMERARVRAMEAASAPGTPNAPSGNDVGALYMDLARMLAGYRGYEGAWRLQVLTDLSQLPDFDEADRYGYGAQRGAPAWTAGPST